jgi:anthranilate synthase
MHPENYRTPNGITVSRSVSNLSYGRGLRGLLRRLDTQRGIYLSSGYEFPGRYSRWDVAAVAPPLEIIARGREVMVRALNERGTALNQMLEPILAVHPHWNRFENREGTLHGYLKPLPALFPEEERSKQPSAFSIVRALLDEFKHPLASRLALVGAFGYDLLLQFDTI